ELYRTYKGGGTSSHHPKMLLKAVIYSYIFNIYSSRKIEEAIKSNLYMVWLCGNCEPDHNTINRFRSKKVAPVLKDIFKQIVLLLAGEGLVSLKEAYVDGTKIEANANRYTFVWGKAIKTNKEKMVKQIDELWQYAQSVADEELQDTAPLDFKSIDAAKVSEAVKQIEEAIRDKQVPQKVKQKLHYVKKNFPAKLNEYKAKDDVLDGRNSYSKTDTDATFMRMKEDHMGNGQLKPGYNVQITTNNQIITNYDAFPNPTDTLTLPAHLESFKELYGHTPDIVTADSGYGSEQNYACLEARNCTAFVKYNYFHQEQQGIRLKKYPFAADHLYYNEEKDFYVCPMGQHMQKVAVYKKKNDNGFEQTISRYQAKNCNGCPLRGVCHQSKDNRSIEVNHALNKHKQKARQLLTSEEGIKHRKQRPQDVEAVFGNIKQNKGFRRFMLRGKAKVTTEFGWIAIAHNLKKKVA
ncbi:IS1182 family transposase, partial [Ferruginibacter paludis]|uniref:IS1182 family transposase n=1 Tax=Ferruginibacter paludis TaxID=1310417 RepID=UPI0025B5E900